VTPLPSLGSAVPRRGNAAVTFLGRSVLAVLGWRVEGTLPDLPKFVVAVAPHTSNWDFVVGAAAMFALDLRLAFISKHTLFRWPFGAMLRWMGGIPVDRSRPHGMVDDSIAAFRAMDRRVLAIAPQGTRRPVPHFKTGFLHIARGAGVPIALAALDYDAKVVRLGPTVTPGDDIEAERERIEAHFAGVRGRRPRAAHAAF
jgi:1-acyl-sn-glycerol-3-phosphate acyltransferase